MSYSPRRSRIHLFDYQGWRTPLPKRDCASVCGNLLPKGLLHPLVIEKVYAAFLRGEYDTAVFQAFREVEIAIRTAGEYGRRRMSAKNFQCAQLSTRTRRVDATLEIVPLWRVSGSQCLIYSPAP